MHIVKHDKLPDSSNEYHGKEQTEVSERYVFLCVYRAFPLGFRNRFQFKHLYRLVETIASETFGK